MNKTEKTSVYTHTHTWWCTVHPASKQVSQVKPMKTRNLDFSFLAGLKAWKTWILVNILCMRAFVLVILDFSRLLLLLLLLLWMFLWNDPLWPCCVFGTTFFFALSFFYYFISNSTILEFLVVFLFVFFFLPLQLLSAANEHDGVYVCVCVTVAAYLQQELPTWDCVTVWKFLWAELRHGHPTN